MTGTGTTDEHGWGVPTHYAAATVAPRTFTEADPITGLLGSLTEWDDAGPDAATLADLAWSPTTYSGRPGRRGAGRSLEDPAPRDQTSLPPTDAAGEPEQETTRGVLAASGSMAVASLVSRITGFVRTALIAAALGAGDVGISYNSGNNFPNMLYELLLGGVLSSVLIPLLVHAQNDDEDEGVAYTQRLLSLAVVGLGIVTLLAVLAAPWIAGAFSKPSNHELTTLFATLLLPEIFFYGLGAMFMAVLNIRRSYAPGAWSPVLNNVVMIVTVAAFWALPGPDRLTSQSITTPQIVVIGVGTTLGIAAQALVLIPALRRSGFHWHWRFRARPNETGRLREVGVLGSWVLAYVVVSQVGVSVIQYVGSHNGGFAVFTNADLLLQMPYGILVVSLLTAIMPRLSRAAARENRTAVLADLSLGARLSAVALIPVTAGLIALGAPIGITLFGYGQYGLGQAAVTGDALAASAFGLFPFAIVMLQMRVFYAMRDGRSPTLINVGMVATKVALVFVTDFALRSAHPEWAVEWLNIATSCSYVVGAVAGHVLLRRRLGPLGFGRVLRTSVQIALVSAVAAAIAFGVRYLAADGLGSAHAGSLVGLVGGAVLGIAVLVVLAVRLRVADVRETIGMLRRR